jgi:hypothetical protein
MTGRRWILLTIATVAMGVGAVWLVACTVDPYGVWRDSTGRKLSVFTDTRKVKFLMNKRYVPSNFDGLLVGTSSSANWDLPVIAGASIYNESIEGGDAVEERILVNEAMRKGHFKLALLVLSHAMTKEHSVKDGLDEMNIGRAIGSLYVFRDEIRVELAKRHHQFDRSDTAPNGQIQLPYPKNLKPLQLTPFQMQVDPVALEQYRQLIVSLRATGTKTVYVIPPMYAPCLAVNTPAYGDVLQKVRSQLPPGPLLDFDGPEYDSFRNDPDNYIDCFHLEPQGATKLVDLLQKLVPDAVNSQR